MEDWKIIEEYPNYMVSSEGKVKSIERNDGRGRHKKVKSYRQDIMQVVILLLIYIKMVNHKLLE